MNRKKDFDFFKDLWITNKKQKKVLLITKIKKNLIFTNDVNFL